MKTAAAVGARIIALAAYVARITKNRSVLMLQGNFCQCVFCAHQQIWVLYDGACGCQCLQPFAPLQLVAA